MQSFVVKKNDQILFQGLTDKSKADLLLEYGPDCLVVKEPIYTIVKEGQTYEEAVAQNGLSKVCYTKQDYVDYLIKVKEQNPNDWDYITYSQKDLDNQRLEVKLPSMYRGIFLYTAWSQVTNGKFPFTVSPEQYALAKKILTSEEDFVKNQNLPQVEALLFIIGTPKFNDFYIKTTGLVFINSNQHNQRVKGLIKSDMNDDGIQTYMLRICVTRRSNGDLLETNNTAVLSHWGY